MSLPRTFAVLVFVVAPALGAQSPAQVAILGDDYAFLHPPTTLPSGETLFAFENRGKVRHEMSLALLKPGVTADDAMRAVMDPGARRRDLYDKSIGVLLAFPGDTAGGRLLVRLIPGRTYVILCTLRDKPDAPQHIALGMAAAFSVPQH
jgi:hypothetical protein